MISVKNERLDRQQSENGFKATQEVFQMLETVTKKETVDEFDETIVAVNKF